MSRTKRRTPNPDETRGRPEIPSELRKVTMTCRVPPHVLAGYDRRARDHGKTAKGKRRSSRGLEVERAFLASEDGPI